MAEEKKVTYQESRYVENTLKLREVLSTLPGFTKQFFRSIEPHTSDRTRISYVYDIRVFFQFLQEVNPSFGNKEITDITLDDLERVEPIDIEEYLEYLKVYTAPDGSRHTNGERGIHRKLSCLRTFYLYYYKKQMIHKNPTLLVDMPKLHERTIIRLDPDEVAELLDVVEYGGANLTGMKKVYYEKNKLRNLAIFTLLLGTGVRVSECIGMDIDDLDFRNNRIHITRKGGKEAFVYFGEEVATALQNYLSESRQHITPVTGHEHALFLSIQKKRMCLQAVENLVTDYAKQVTTMKHITPHKLRSTFGTNLYQETGDIYLVAEVLGHSDVNTTRKHYAAMDESRKREAAKRVSLRKSQD